MVGKTFNVETIDINGNPVSLLPNKSASITFNYTNEEILEVEENSLALYYWDGLQWVKELSSFANIFDNTVTATVDHFSNWALMGELVQAEDACLNVTEIPVKECNALVDLYNSTGGDDWTNKTNWLQTHTPSDWNGITVVNGFIEKVYLIATILLVSFLILLDNFIKFQEMLLF